MHPEEVPRGSKRYEEVLEQGCLSYRCGPYLEDIDCNGDYDWTCDNCPIVVEGLKNKTDEYNHTSIYRKDVFES